MTEYTSPVRAFQSLEYTIYWSGPVKFANHCQLLDLVKLVLVLREERFANLL